MLLFFSKPATSERNENDDGAFGGHAQRQAGAGPAATRYFPRPRPRAPKARAALLGILKKCAACKDLGRFAEEDDDVERPAPPREHRDIDIDMVPEGGAPAADFELFNDDILKIVGPRDLALSAPPHSVS